MTLHEKITASVVACVRELYGVELQDRMVQLQETRPEFEGQLTPAAEDKPQGAGGNGGGDRGVSGGEMPGTDKQVQRGEGFPEHGGCSCAVDSYARGNKMQSAFRFPRGDGSESPGDDRV